MRASGHVGYPPGMTRSFFAACVARDCCTAALVTARARLGRRSATGSSRHLAAIRTLAEGPRRSRAAAAAAKPNPTLAGVANWADDLRSNDPGLGRTFVAHGIT